MFQDLPEARRTTSRLRTTACTAYQRTAAIGATVAGRDLRAAPGLSVKLSALHPRYEESQRDRVLRALGPAVAALAREAKAAGIGLTVDAEEAERLDLSLDLVAALAGNPALAGWDGLGLAVQAYQKRALALLDCSPRLPVAQGGA